MTLCGLPQIPKSLNPYIPLMSDRYFVETPIAGDQAILAGLEAHHLIHVMRRKAWRKR